jgi:hypothetical protein
MFIQLVLLLSGTLLLIGQARPLNTLDSIYTLHSCTERALMGLISGTQQFSAHLLGTQGRRGKARMIVLQ